MPKTKNMIFLFKEQPFHKLSNHGLPIYDPRRSIRSSTYVNQSLGIFPQPFPLPAKGVQIVAHLQWTCNIKIQAMSAPQNGRCPLLPHNTTPTKGANSQKGTPNWRAHSASARHLDLWFQDFDARSTISRSSSREVRMRVPTCFGGLF